MGVLEFVYWMSLFAPPQPYPRISIFWAAVAFVAIWGWGYWMEKYGGKEKR